MSGVSSVKAASLMVMATAPVAASSPGAESSPAPASMPAPLSAAPGFWDEDPHPTTLIAAMFVIAAPRKARPKFLLMALLCRSGARAISLFSGSLAPTGPRGTQVGPDDVAVGQTPALVRGLLEVDQRVGRTAVPGTAALAIRVAAGVQDRHDHR